MPENPHSDVAFLTCARDVDRAARDLPFRLRYYNNHGRADKWIEDLAEYPGKYLRGDSLVYALAYQNFDNVAQADSLLASLLASEWIVRGGVDMSLSTAAFLGVERRKPAAVRYPREFSYAFNHDNQDASAYVSALRWSRSWLRFFSDELWGDFWG